LITNDVAESTNFPVSTNVVPVDNFGAVRLVNWEGQILTFKNGLCLDHRLEPKVY